jgi:hypothetical protein
MADNQSHAHPYNRGKSLFVLASSPNDCWLIRCDIGRVLAINDLPDDDLLSIFDFCVFSFQYPCLFKKFAIKTKIEWWQSLVHVCRRWRGLVFGSARRLNLQLFCGHRTTARKSLDVWPALPLIVLRQQVDSVIPELEHSDRICHIELDGVVTGQGENNHWTAMQVPFPELVALRLSLSGWPLEPALPDSFLGGSAPRLRFLTLHSVPFPGLPKLLLSATHLVSLELHTVPLSGYISPEAMATCLSVLTSLEVLYLLFESPQSSPDQESRPSPPLTRSVLPAFTVFRFKGANEYLEDLVSRIDAPRLYRLLITVTDDIDFDTPELNQFIGRTPTFGAYNEARLIFCSYEALVRLQSHPEQSDHRGIIEVKIFCQVPARQLSLLAQISISSSRLLLTVENLYFEVNRFNSLSWTDGIENTDWLNILHPFTVVKSLYLSEAIWPGIALALQELTGGRTTEVLPALQNVLLEGFQPSEPIQEGIAQFISARQLTNHPVAISVWDKD